MGRKVAIVGVSQTTYGRKQELRIADIIFEATKTVFRGLPLTLEDIDYIVTAGNDIFDGTSISDAILVEAAGGHHKSEMRVVEDGAFALMYAFMQVQSGLAQTALVVAGGKTSEVPMHHAMNMMTDPFFERPLGLDAVSAAALQARRYMDRFGVKEEQMAMAAVKNRKNALNNPHAHLKGNFTVKEVLDSASVASPLRRLEICPVSDGACAVIIASEEIAQKVTTTPVWIKGLGQSWDTFHLGFKELCESRSCHVAAKSAYNMAEVRNPLKELDLVELYEAFAFHEVMLYEALNFCKPGEGGSLIERGITEMDGELPVNPSGGALSANPMLATGLIRVAEAALQIMGQAGKRQVPDVRTALAHGTCGLCLQGNIVFILGKDE
jgi:acetyl-CoA C-acetyltransferase